MIKKTLSIADQTPEEIKPFITGVDIKEFRGIHHCEEPIPLTKFSVLVGRNNSGKSAILEAISLL